MLASIPLYTANVEYYNLLLAFWASTNHLVDLKVQLKNFWGPKVAHNNLGWPAKELWRQRAGQEL